MADDTQRDSVYRAMPVTRTALRVPLIEKRRGAMAVHVCAVPQVEHRDWASRRYRH